MIFIPLIKRKKHLEIELSSVPDFDKPSERLEQYKTLPEVAAEIAWSIVVERGLFPRVTVDLGCGTGSLCYSFLLLGAPYCTCLDIDANSLLKARGYALERGLSGYVDFVVTDVRSLALRGDIAGSLVVMNPPWGTRERGIDSVFLERAMGLSDRVVSIHPLPEQTESSYVVRKLKDNNWKIIKVRVTDFPIKATLPHHEKRMYKTKAIIVEAFKDAEQGQR